MFDYDDDQFLRIYPGNSREMLHLDTGYYQLLFIFEDASYLKKDSIFIKPNGINYYEIEQLQPLQKDSFILKIDQLIEDNMLTDDNEYDKKIELDKIYQLYQKNFNHSGLGGEIKGYVVDEHGEALPFANVVVQGTKVGTQTDFDGYFTLNVPLGKNFLEVSYLGYETKEIIIDYTGLNIIILKEPTTLLEEVVVVDYKIPFVSIVGASTGVVNVKSSGILKNGSRVPITVINNKDKAGIQISFTKNATQQLEFWVNGARFLFNNTPLCIVDEQVYAGNIIDLIESVSFLHIEVLQQEDAVKHYGDKAKNGVIILKSADFGNDLKGADYDEAFLEAATQSSSIRSNFADYAFWQPQLTTNKNGKATFQVTFPDDVTNWQTHYFAMNGKRQSGQSSNEIKSYKPFMAQLKTPRFLVKDDTSYAIGKVLNYSKDSIKIETTFTINDTIQKSETQFCKDVLVDALAIYTDNDSLEITYRLDNTDGYFDGEKKEIPVLPKGIIEKDGQFLILESDSSVQLTFNAALGKVCLSAQSNSLHVIEQEIKHVKNYRYYCNEQIASKLKMLLAEQSIASYLSKDFKNEKAIKKLIKQLYNRRNEEGLWGWWKNSKPSSWISVHVLEALSKAAQMGYTKPVDKNVLAKQLTSLYNASDFNTKLILLYIFKELNIFTSIDDLLLEAGQITLSFNQRLQLLRLKQLYNLKYELAWLSSYKKNTIYGNVYFSDENEPTNLLQNDIQNTLLAYQILRDDSLSNKKILHKIHHYFLEKREVGFWRNTYESAKIIETILPDLLRGENELTQPTLTISGSVNQIVEQFPFEMDTQATDTLYLKNTGNFPVYIGAFQAVQNSNPKVKSNNFKISTSFKIKVENKLTAGEAVILQAQVTVKKDADYVMIKVPIPAGCSYTTKPQFYNKESHREYYKHETAIFCERLAKGDYIFEIELMPKFSGSYSLNPAVVELMYFPVFSANNEIKKVMIK